MGTRKMAKRLGALGAVALAGIAIVGWSGSAFAQANAGSLRKLTAKGVPTTQPAFSGGACPGRTCFGAPCLHIGFVAPVWLSIDQTAATNSNISTGCLQISEAPPSAANAGGISTNGFSECFGSSGFMILKKPSGNSYTIALGGQLCIDDANSFNLFGSFHMGYVVEGGTGPHVSAQGTGDFNLNLIQSLTTGAFSGTSVDMSGNITP
jgi:hypothetical protein